MKKILFIILIIPFLVTGQHMASYRIDLKQAQCIESKKPCMKFRQADGTIITRYKNHLIAQLKNGIKITDYSTGKRIIMHPDGKRVIRDFDSTVTVYMKDGKKKIISLDGKTPWGNEVKKHRRVLKRRYFVAEIIYSKYYSDHNMNKYTRRFYRELASQVHKWMYKNKLPSYRLSLVISNCRHCKTGYCRRKNVKEIIVVAYRNKKRYKGFRFKYKDLMAKNAFIPIAAQTVRFLMK